MPACPHCAAEVPASAETCPACGRSIESAPGHPPAKANVSALAIAALILGVGSLILLIVTGYMADQYGWAFPVLVFPTVPGALSIVTGLIAIRQIRRKSGYLRGKAGAWVGLVAGSLGVLPFVFVASLVMLFSFGILHPRRMGEGGSAVGSLRTINTAAETYRATYHRGYPESLSTLGGPMPVNGQVGPPNAREAGLIDPLLASGRKSGYVFIYKVTGRDESNFPIAYTVTAAPVAGCGKAGNCYFTDESLVIRVEANRMADEHSLALAGGR